MLTETLADPVLDPLPGIEELAGRLYGCSRFADHQKAGTGRIAELQARCKTVRVDVIEDKKAWQPPALLLAFQVVTGTKGVEYGSGPECRTTDTEHHQGIEALLDLPGESNDFGDGLFIMGQLEEWQFTGTTSSLDILMKSPGAHRLCLDVLVIETGLCTDGLAHHVAVIKDQRHIISTRIANDKGTFIMTAPPDFSSASPPESTGGASARRQDRRGLKMRTRCAPGG